MRMGTGRTHGQILAATGGAALLGSLWLPWYTVRLPQSAWQTFTAAPSVLVATGVLVALLSVLELSQRTGDTSRLAILAGAVAAVIVAYRVAVPPSAASVHVSWGAYMSLASALIILLGGALAAAEGRLPDLPIPAVGLAPAATQPAPPRIS